MKIQRRGNVSLHRSSGFTGLEPQRVPMRVDHLLFAGVLTCAVDQPLRLRVDLICCKCGYRRPRVRILEHSAGSAYRCANLAGYRPDYLSAWNQANCAAYGTYSRPDTTEALPGVLESLVDALPGRLLLFVGQGGRQVPELNASAIGAP
jgi:hypothetical protein